jgi:hypothetical protein
VGVPPAQRWARLTAVSGSSCIEGTTQEPVLLPEGPEVAVVPCDPGAFPQGLMPALRFRDIPIGGQRATLKISARCEEITVEASGPAIDRLGLLKPFAQIKGTGKGVTIFAGVKGGLELEPVSLNAKVGPYVTVDYQGNVMDYGVRIAPGSVNAESGPFGIKVWEAQAMDFSYVGISDYMPLIGTQ